MFTGIIQSIGKIVQVKKSSSDFSYSIECKHFFSKDYLSKEGEIILGESISVNGVCQTVYKINSSQNQLFFNVLNATLQKTNFNHFRTNQKVHLERALNSQTRLGGHFVSGHVNCCGKVTKINHNKLNWILEIQFPKEYRNYIFNEGAICLDGASLTIAEVNHIKHIFKLNIVQHTIESTLFSVYKVGQLVNLEFDLLVRSVIEQKKLYDKKSVSLETLSKWGY